jgi:hypothetical protein
LRSRGGLVTESAKVATSVFEGLWSRVDIYLPISRRSPAKADSDQVQEGAVDAFSLKRPVPLGAGDGRRAAAGVELKHLSDRGVSWGCLDSRDIRLRS